MHGQGEGASVKGANCDRTVVTEGEGRGADADVGNRRLARCKENPFSRWRIRTPAMS